MPHVHLKGCGALVRDAIYEVPRVAALDDDLARRRAQAVAYGRVRSVDATAWTVEVVFASLAQYG